MIKVLVADKLAQVGLDYLQSKPDVQIDVKIGLDEDGLAATVGDYDGMVIRSGVKITAKVLANAGNLKAIARAGVGVDNVDLDAATKAGILVMNTPDANTLATGELTMALMLAVARHIPDANAHIKAGEWNRNQFVGTQLSGKTLGLIGFGRIGQTVAKRALAFDMKVIAYDPFFKGEAAMDGQVKIVRTVDELLPVVDYLSVHAPKSAETAGMISTEQLAKMKDGVRLINAARGGIYDEQALADALASGKVAAAGIDVYTAEPPTGNPLLTAPNTVLTPHLGASSKEAQAAVSLEAAEVLLDYLVNGEIRSAVNVVGLPASMTAKDQAYADLAMRMGRMLAPLCESISTVTVTTHGSTIESICPTLARYAMIELLSPHMDTRVNLINVSPFAKQRNIELKTNTSIGSEKDLQRVVIEVSDNGKLHSIEGTVLDDGLPRVLAIDGYRMDMVPDGPMLLIMNDDLPGVIGLVGSTFGEHKVNIADMSLSRKAKTALMVLNLDEAAPEDAINALRAKKPPIQLVKSVILPPRPGTA